MYVEERRKKRCACVTYFVGTVLVAVVFFFPILHSHIAQFEFFWCPLIVTLCVCNVTKYSGEDTITSHNVHILFNRKYVQGYNRIKG